MEHTALQSSDELRTMVTLETALAAERVARRAAEAASARTARLQALTAGLASALTPGAVVEVMASQGAAAAGASTAAVAVLDPEGLQLEIVGASAPAAEGRERAVAGPDAPAVVTPPPLPLGAPLPMCSAVLEQTPVWLGSRAEAEARFPGLGAVMTRGGDHAYAALPLVTARRVLGALSFTYPAHSTFDPDDRALLVALAQLCAQALERAWLYAEVVASHERLQSLSQRLIETQEQERRHLARELHDEVGQALTGVCIALDLAERLPPEERAPRLDEVRRSIAELIERTRALSLDLRPAMLDEGGLLPALLWQLRRYGEQTGIAVDLRHWGLEQRLPPTVETTAYRVVQEALTNVARHAGVAMAAVTLLASPEQLLVQVRDGGRGFVYEEVLAGGRSSGLAGMQERAALLGGTLSVETSPGEGTCITANLPLTQERPL